jgi:hypothetical protein
MDRFECYELCVQSPRHMVPFLRGVHGGEPAWLREEFCGTAALSRRWVEEGQRAGERRQAVAVDLDATTIERARRENQAAGLGDSIHLVQGDVMDRALPGPAGCDVLFVGNFSIGYIPDRSSLDRYMRQSHERLSAGNAGFGGGVLVCDTYTGLSAFKEGSVTRTHPGRGHEVVRYTWEQREADALTAMVTNVVHFQVEVDGEVVERFPNAFVYRWRLWTIPELRESMMQTGFASTEVYQDVGPQPEPMAHGRELRESGIVCVVGRA